MTDTRTRMLFVITKGTWGGAQRYVYDVATHLPKEICAVSVALGTPGILKEKLDAVGVHTLPLQHLARDVSLLNDLRAWRELLSLFYAERPAIVHLNSSKAAGLGALAARIALVPRIVSTIHGLPYEEERPRLSKIAIAFFTYLTCLLSTDVIVLSERARRSLARFPFLARKIHVVPLGIEVPKFAARATARAAIASRIGVPLTADDTLIVSIGELHKNKGYDLVFSAFATLAHAGNHFRYIIIGEGEERSALERQIVASDLTGKVFLAGFVPDAASLLPAANLFLIPSRKEGTPYVLLEALAAGVPIIASAVGDIPETLASVEARLYEPHDCATLNALIQKCFIQKKSEHAQEEDMLQNELLSPNTLATMIHKICLVYFPSTKKDSPS